MFSFREFTTGSNNCTATTTTTTMDSNHHYHQTNCDLRGATGAMAYLKSSPYAMNGIAGIGSPGDLLHPSHLGYPGEYKCEK